jgi:hypothetical protein
MVFGRNKYRINRPRGIRGETGARFDILQEKEAVDRPLSCVLDLVRGLW